MCIKICSYKIARFLNNSYNFTVLRTIFFLFNFKVSFKNFVGKLSECKSFMRWKRDKSSYRICILNNSKQYMNQLHCDVCGRAWQKFLECLTWEFIKKYESTQLWCVWLNPCSWQEGASAAQCAFDIPFISLFAVLHRMSIFFTV